MAEKKNTNRISWKKRYRKESHSNKKTKTKKTQNRSQRIELEKPDYRKRRQARWLIWTAITMLIGLFFLKVIPMEMYGEDILFDASAHITITTFILYFIWFFIDQNKSWRIFYLFFSLVVLTLVALQRIVAEKHDDIGLILGFVLSIIAILVPRWKQIKNKFEF